MKCILGEKQNMTQVYTADGAAVPATIVKVGPVTVIQKKDSERDGYSALQVGYGEQKEQRINKPLGGHFGKKGAFKVVREFRLDASDDFNAIEEGDTLDVSAFEAGDIVRVSGTSKGKGFQGVVKRHGFGGGRRTHGQKHSEREPGSIGVGGVQRVIKGTKMAGRMGGDRITLSKLEVVHVDAENGLLYIKGALPGRRGSLLLIQGKTVKK